MPCSRAWQFGWQRSSAEPSNPRQPLAMRIGALSDIHGNLPALKAVLRDLAYRQVDTIVNLGDSLSGPVLPSETAAFL